MSTPRLAAVVAAELPVDVAAAGAPYLLDVREHDEWEAGHVAGAVHIPMSELVERLAEVPKDTDVVVVCRSGNRSAAVTDYLGRGGWTVRNLADGMIGWASLGRPMVSETAGPPTVL
jgi:rhodanese-related sulfurtransferase